MTSNFFQFAQQVKAMPLGMAADVLPKSHQDFFVRAVDVLPPPLTPPVLDTSVAQKILNEIGGGSMAHQEMKRITAMEVCRSLTDEEAEYVSSQFVLAHAYASGFRLMRAQAEGIVNYLQCGGMFGKIGVGGGKTLLSLMILSAAYRKGRHNPLLSVPSHVYTQLWNSDTRFARARVQFDMPFLSFAGLSRPQRLALAKSGRKGVYVITHSLLSQPDAHEILAALKPKTIVIDEAHAFANARAARTRRMVQSMDLADVEVVVLSGTMTKKTVLDYHHLAKMSLKTNCPLPLQPSLAGEWGLVIDAAVEPGTSIRAGPLTPLVGWAKQHYPEQQHMLGDDVLGFRRAFRLRMDSAPGVVTVDDTGVGASLTVSNIAAEPVAEGFADLQQKIKDVEELWLAPNGDEIEVALQKHKWLFELSAGFYNQMVWPTPEKVAHNRQISLDEATLLIEDARLAHEARNEVGSQMRAWLKDNAHDGMDTPMLVFRHLAEKGVPKNGLDLYSAWTQWHALKKPEHPEREKKPVRICSYKVDAAVGWAKEQDRGGIIWSWNREMNLWMFEELEKAGLPAVHCTASGAIDVMLADPEKHKELQGKFLCCSIPSHGEGKNLQFMDRMYVLQWPRSAKVVEQMLGRLHRPGQESDEVQVVTNVTLPWDEENMAACIIDSLYIHQTSGKQKLIYCGWNPLPKMYHPEALRQRGFDNVALDAVQRKLLDDKFGG